MANVCAVCFTGVQLIPGAAIAARAWFVHWGGSALEDESDGAIPESLDEQLPHHVYG